MASLGVDAGRNLLMLIMRVCPMWLKKNLQTRETVLKVAYVYKGKLVGMVWYSSSELGKKAASLGYYLAEDAGGKGIMTRSVKAVLHYAFLRI